MNILGELLDVDAEVGLPDDLDPDETAAEIVARYEPLWTELTHEETFAPNERFKVEERLHRLNQLGFDVEEIQLEATGGATACDSTRTSSSRATTATACSA